MLSIMYPTVYFYCYSEVNNDVHICKFNEIENKTIIERTHIYTPINVKNHVCILHENEHNSCNHFKALIPKISKRKPKPIFTVR